MSENLVDDSPSWSLIIFQRILKSVKKWPRYSRFSFKSVYPHSTVNNLVIFQDIGMSFGTQWVKALNIFFTNRQYLETNITGFISLQSCGAHKIAKNGQKRLFSTYYGDLRHNHVLSRLPIRYRITSVHLKKDRLYGGTQAYPFFGKIVQSKLLVFSGNTQKSQLTQKVMKLRLWGHHKSICR